MKYLVWGDNLQILPEIVIEAKTEKEAKEKYQELFENGELTVMGNELVVAKPKKVRAKNGTSK